MSRADICTKYGVRSIDADVPGSYSFKVETLHERSIVPNKPSKKLELAKVSDLTTTDIQIFAKGKAEQSPPQLVQAEINALSLPYAVLNEKEAKTSTGHHIVRLMNDDGKSIAFEWSVWPQPGRGMPTMFSQCVLFALMQIAAEQKELYGEVPKKMFYGSHSQLCRRLGLPQDGYYRAQIRKHILIHVSTNCKSVRAFKDKQRNALTVESFRFIRSAGFAGQKDPDGNVYEQNFVIWDDPIWTNLNAKYVKQLDLSFMRTLKSQIAQLLYTHLSNLFSDMKGWPYVDPDYTWLAERMGLKVYADLKRARQQFKQAIAELAEQNYIAKAEWVDWKIRFYPGVRYTYGEAAPRLERKKQARRSKRATSCTISNAMPQPAIPTPEEERDTVLIRQATRLMLGQTPDEPLLLQHGWTIADAKSRMREIKNQL